jgi:hypothetical protein
MTKAAADNRRMSRPFHLLVLLHDAHSASFAGIHMELAGGLTRDVTPERFTVS